MPPKGKKGKKADDNWDEGLGEAADPIAQADADAKAADAAADAEDDAAGGGGGGLMAALKKNKEKRKKKGKDVDNDFLDGEDPTGTPTVDDSLDMAAKAPAEATMDDDEDVFAGNAKKGKGGKGGKQQQAKAAADDDEEGGGVKTKAQKEKEKKEREKQRKKEQVCALKRSDVSFESHADYFPLGRTEEEVHACTSTPEEGRAQGQRACRRARADPRACCWRQEEEAARRSCGPPEAAGGAQAPARGRGAFQGRGEGSPCRGRETEQGGGASEGRCSCCEEGAREEEGRGGQEGWHLQD